MNIEQCSDNRFIEKYIFVLGVYVVRNYFFFLDYDHETQRIVIIIILYIISLAFENIYKSNLL